MPRSTSGTASTVSEIEVLLATLVWVAQRGARLRAVSVAAGQVISQRETVQRLPAAFEHAGIEYQGCEFRARGPDVVAESAREYWQIECKGIGVGSPQTHRNNFDRALASVVSFFIDTPPSTCPHARPLLALALPYTDIFVSQVRQRVSVALRRRLDLWILLYEPEQQCFVMEVEPSMEIGE